MQLVFVVERYDPPLTDMFVVGAWRTHAVAWQYVMGVLSDEKVRLEAEEHTGGNVVDAAERLKITEFFHDNKAKYYLLSNASADVLGFYITEIEFHE